MNTVTSTTLLDALLQADDSDGWKHFHERYWPMIVAFARKQGLADNDAEDVGQETVMAFVQSYGKGGFDRGKGRLRSWLFGIASHKCIDVLRRLMRENVVCPETSGTCFLDRIPSADEMKKTWTAAWQQGVLKACLQEVAQEVQPKTYQAFDLYVLQNWSVEDVARKLGMTENAVYIAKNRVLSRARELLPRMEEIW